MREAWRVCEPRCERHQSNVRAQRAPALLKTGNSLPGKIFRAFCIVRDLRPMRPVRPNVHSFPKDDPHHHLRQYVDQIHKRRNCARSGHNGKLSSKEGKQQKTRMLLISKNRVFSKLTREPACCIPEGLPDCSSSLSVNLPISVLHMSDMKKRHWRVLQPRRSVVHVKHHATAVEPQDLAMPSHTLRCSVTSS